MAKKTLTVPQAGTQPAAKPTPMENMLNGAIPTPEKPASRKKAVNFLCDPELFKAFKLYCTRNSLTMTSVLENAMTQIINSDTQR